MEGEGELGSGGCGWHAGTKVSSAPAKIPGELRHWEGVHTFLLVWSLVRRWKPRTLLVHESGGDFVSIRVLQNAFYSSVLLVAFCSKLILLG
jgi:hypothetical protein